MTVVLIIICIGIVFFFLGLLFGSMLRDGELRELEKQLAERVGENRRLREHCEQLQKRLVDVTEVGGSGVSASLGDGFLI